MIYAHFFVFELGLSIPPVWVSEIGVWNPIFSWYFLVLVWFGVPPKGSSACDGS